MTAIPRARLVLTDSRTIWHVAQPTTTWYAHCGAQTRPPLGDRPTSTEMCHHCERAYRREAMAKVA